MCRHHRIGVVRHHHDFPFSANFRLELPPQRRLPSRWLSCARRRGLCFRTQEARGLQWSSPARREHLRKRPAWLASACHHGTKSCAAHTAPVPSSRRRSAPAARRAVAVYLGRQGLVRTKGIALCELLMIARRPCRHRGCSAISGTHEAGIRTGSGTRCARPASLGASRPSRRPRG